MMPCASSSVVAGGLGIARRSRRTRNLMAVTRNGGTEAARLEVQAKKSAVLNPIIRVKPGDR